MVQNEVRLRVGRLRGELGIMGSGGVAVAVVVVCSARALARCALLAHQGARRVLLAATSTGCSATISSTCAALAAAALVAVPSALVLLWRRLRLF
mmetsp:Transcript_11879/g.25442  ORF Transcript_11879/g.25442 Transcript_11879/m.25442 type:complete len:95 (-) Transcript_11879:957-1241(-)